MFGILGQRNLRVFIVSNTVQTQPTEYFLEEEDDLTFTSNISNYTNDSIRLVLTCSVAHTSCCGVVLHTIISWRSRGTNEGPLQFCSFKTAGCSMDG